jgi:hypothetical protein
MRQPGTEYNNVGSQAGVLWEMTTRADETPPPPNEAQAQAETSTKQSMVGSSSLHSHLPDDTATHQPRQTHTCMLRSFLSTITLPVEYWSPSCRIDSVVAGSLSFSTIASCRHYTCNRATPCLPKRWCSVSSLLPMKPDEQSLCLQPC